MENILVIGHHSNTDWAAQLDASFRITRCSVEQYQTDDSLAANADMVIIGSPSHDTGADAGIDLALCRAIKQHPRLQAVPLLGISCCNDLPCKLATFDAGCDDVIDEQTPPAELAVRIQKALFHKRCNDQLKSQVQLANQMAFSAMADTSNLGANIQFLLESAKCDTLDELGMLFFSTIQHYDLSCSLQLRSEQETKNMEQNGMAKELESQLLNQLSGSGRYFDFGKRTVCNYGRASVLIKNMPQDNPDRYGQIKDNTFALMQGLDARIQAIDTTHRLREEHERLLHISQQVKQVMMDIDESYQVVMRNIAEVVEDMASQIDRAIPVLALSEEQERFIEQVAHGCVLRTNHIFNDGLQVDRTFHRLMQHLDQAMGRPPDAH